MASVSARRAPTPRPSISPLSTASRTRKPSLEAIAITAMQDTDEYDDAEVDNVLHPANAEVGEPHDDGSSSLSEPDDDNDESEEQNGVDDDMADGEELVARHLLEVDSEAETERLEQTPQKLRKHADNLGRTPSKLSQAATADEDVSEPPSPVPDGVGAASSTSTIATAGQKRKRSDTADSSLTSADSDIGESPRKRAHDSTTEGRLGADEEIDELEQVQESVDLAEDALVLEETRGTPPVRAKGWPKGRKGKQKGKKQKDPVEETEVEHTEETAELPEEPSEEDPVKTEEQLKVKKEASSFYENLTKEFRAFREKMYNERLATLSKDLQLLAEPDCEHPEYLRQVACVDTRLQKQISEAHAYYNYKLRCIRERTLGERSQLHSQYFQRIREQREDILYKLGEDWYAIQKERRQSHQENDDAYIFKFPTKKSVQIRQQAKYNQEVSVLSGVAKYVGFPAAPDINGVDGDHLEDDLKAMKISRRATQTVVPPRPVYMVAPSITQNERLAHEKYLEQTPWARPQAPIHAHSTPGLTHTPDWAEPGTHSSAAHQFARNPGGPHQIPQNSSPFATPVPQKQALQYEQPAAFALNSDGPEPEPPLPSSVVAAPPTTGRLSFLHHAGGSSNQTSPIVFPKPRENGTAGADMPGYRNISGVSGASTIDAPEQDVGSNHKSSLPLTLPHEESSGPQVFDTSQIHTHPRDERREVYASTGFRPQEGAFGTPAPLHTPGA